MGWTRWRDEARCNQFDVDPEWWFPVGHTSHEARMSAKIAKSYCAECPVISQCFAAFESFSPLPDGIWAGTDAHEYIRLRRRELRRDNTRSLVDNSEAVLIVKEAIDRGWTPQTIAAACNVSLVTVSSLARHQYDRVLKSSADAIAGADLSGDAPTEAVYMLPVQHPPGTVIEDVLIGADIL